MHSTRACFAFITMGMKELQRKLLKQSLYEKFFWGQAVELALVLVTMTLKVLVTSPTLEASPMPKLNFSVAKEFFVRLAWATPQP